jgi:uncharacterized protein (TIGR03382 family)
MLLLLTAAALASPSASPDRGLYAGPLTVTLSAEAGGALYYSLDGGEPTTPYIGPIEIGETATLRAAELGSDGALGPAGRWTYLLLSSALPKLDAVIVDDPSLGPALIDALSAVPSVALTVGAPLGYEETPASLEWMEPAGETEQLDMGLKRTGRTSVVYPKTSLRMEFRGEYGSPRWRRELYPDDGLGWAPASSFDSLALRSGNHDSVFYLAAQAQYTRARWMDDSQRAMGHLAPHGRYVHAWLDGDYIGLYHLRERFSADMLATYLGGEEEDYESVNGGSPVDGDGAGWAALVAASGDFEAAAAYLDLANFLDYMVLNFYAANAWDWLPSQNWVAAGPAGTGPFRFQSYDNDICLVYPVETNILTAPGPSGVFAALLALGHPDFRVALKDAVHRNLEGEGPLVAAEATARYAAIADEIEPLLLPEAARWGGGWWRPADQWVTERDRVLTFLGARDLVLLAQLRAAGWIDLPAPLLSLEAGDVEAGTVLHLEGEADAELWLTLDGSDPRQPGGEPAPTAREADTVILPYSTVVSARLRRGEEWGPIEARLYEVDAPAAVVLNEWSAVEPGETLSEGDPALGAVEGNGGDWLEFVILTDHTDLRGWSIELRDRAGLESRLTFSEAPVLSDLRSGTLLTVAEDMPEDTAYDPAGGDWRLHLRAGRSGSGVSISALPFDVSPRDWQLTLRDREGRLRYGPVGEGQGGLAGIGKDEVGALQADPGPDTRRDGAYAAADQSSFGAPNRWAGGEQDLSALRDGIDGGAEAAPPSAPSATVEIAVGCAAVGRPPPGRWALAALSLALLGRRRGGPRALGAGALCAALTLLLSACGGGKAGPPEADAPAGDSAAPGDSPAPADSGDDARDSGAATHPEVCNGADDDGDGLIDEADPDLADGLPFFADGDQDDYGDESTIVTACAAGDGAAVLGGDCDDADPSAHPGAPEGCDGVDHDCDGLVASEPGSSAACAVLSCAEALSLGLTDDGPRYILLPSGTAAALWCDQHSEGGGWTLGFVRSSAAGGSQGDFGAGEEGLTSLSASPEAASLDSAGHRGWIDLNTFEWAELKVSAYAAGAEAWRSEPIARDTLRISFGEPGYLLYGDPSPYYWCGGPASYTSGGSGGVDDPEGAPSSCKGHSGLGGGWDFSESPSANLGLTLCGADGANFLASSWGGGWISYGTPGGAEALWVR